MSRPVQLQFNASGAWRSGLDFDAGAAPPELFEAADQLARLTGASMRIVRCERGANGKPTATRDVLMHWSREKGWVQA